MRLSTKNISFARRFSIFCLFVGIFSIFLGGFYYKYMPENQAELNTRGFRILNQLSANLETRDSVFAGTFPNVEHCPKCTQPEQQDLLRQIREHTHCILDTLRDSACKTNWVPDSIRLKPAKKEGWSMVYEIDCDDSAIIRIPDFIEPVLAARDDLFESYMLLQKDPPVPDSAHLMRILYLQGPISASSSLHVDSAIALQKNSDGSDISNLTIGGEVYTLFYQPFTLSGSKLVLCGLIGKAGYDRQVKNLPTHFVVSMFLMILLGLIFLPFLKVFFLSPRENVYKRDVLSIVLAIYLGSAILVLSGVYFMADLSARDGVDDSLKDLSGQLERDIRGDIHAAGLQMETYVSKFKELEDSGLGKVLTYKDTDPGHIRIVDGYLTPADYPLVARMIWFDSAGNTLAKWNPFKFISPPASVKDYGYFARLRQKNEDDEGLVLSAGKSNITSEFQVFLARRLKTTIDTSNLDSASSPVQSFGVVMPFYLHSGLRPVLPKGYGFCLVDNRTMNVLMHSDQRRNLSENLYRETGNNPRVKNCIDFKLETWIEDVDLYGSPHTFYTRPVGGQDVSLVVFYDNNTHAENIFRMIHFGAETVLYLALAFCLCLLLSTALANRPSKLSFNLDPVEWVRPLRLNYKSYDFTQRYFLALVGLAGGYFVLILLGGVTGWFGHPDIRIAFYISFLLPFYALWGFVASRRKVKSRFPAQAPILGQLAFVDQWVGRRPRRFVFFFELFISSKPVVVFLLLLNLGILWLVYKPEMDHSWWVLVFVWLFQALALAAMAWYYKRIFFKSWPGEKNFSRKYARSLYYSVLVMSILPVMGFLWYGWSAEKIQFLRADQLSIAGNNIAHMRYIAQDLLPGLKDTVLKRLESKPDFEKRLFDSCSRYLTTEKLMALPGQPDITTSHDPDQPYIKMLDELYVITAGEYNSYSIQKRSADTSWEFVSHQPDSISLIQTVQLDQKRGIGFTTDSLLKDFRIRSDPEASLFTFYSIGVIPASLLLLAVILFLACLPRLLGLTVNRVFLLEFLQQPIPVRHSLIKFYFRSPEFPRSNFIENAKGMCSLDEQEVYILQTMLMYKPIFQKIWEGLPKAERYFLYDFARDGYTNYRDSEMLILMLESGLLRCRDDNWQLFAISFREFLLLKKGSKEIADLKDEFSIPGVWATIRIPMLIVIAACALLLLMTQETISHQITVVITSVGAIIPVILEITKKVGSKGGG